MAQIGPSTLETPTDQVSVYPKHMAYFSKRLNGFSKNTVRLNTQSANVVNQNGIVSITLPTNSIVDLKSLVCLFKCTPTARAIPDAAGLAIYPRFTTSLLERVQISVGGVSVGNACNMNSAIAYLKQISTMSADKADGLPTLWASPQGFRDNAGAAGVVRGKNTNNPNWQCGPQQRTPVSSGTNSSVGPNVCVANGTALNGEFPDESVYAVELFNGFVSESQPAYLDTSALGAIRMDLLLSPASVFMGVDAATGIGAGICNSYQLSEIFCLVDVISIADGIYNSAMAAYLQSGNSLKVPFSNYFLFTGSIQAGVGGFNTSLRVNVRSQNIRRVWNSWRYANYNAGGGAVASLVDSATTNYFKFGTADLASFESIQLQINNIQVPSQPAQAGAEVSYYNRKALNKMNNQLGACLADHLIGQENAHDLFYSVIGLDDRLSNGLRTLSGYSSAGTQTSIYVNTSNTPAGNVSAALQHVCFVECTSLLLVGQNRQITVIS